MMTKLGAHPLLALAIALVIVAAFASADELRDDAKLRAPGHPSLAIFTSPKDDCADMPAYIHAPSPPTSCLNANYVRWIEAAGVRVVPLQWNASFEYHKSILLQVNGLLFPGGGLDSHPEVYDQYFAKAKAIYNFAVDANTHAPHSLVLWGTCQGFQLMCALAADTLEVILNGYCTETMYRLMPLDFTPAQPASRLLNATGTPAYILNFLRDANSTLNMHNDGVPPESFNATSPLGRAFSVLSTNVAGNGHTFVSTMEHKEFPFFAIQWHAEWPPFDWSDARIAHTAASSSVSQYMAAFLRDQLLKSSNRFSAPQGLEDVVVQRNARTYSGWGKEVYWIDVPDNLTRGADGSCPSRGSVSNVGAALLGAAVASVVVGLVSYYTFAVQGKCHKEPAYSQVQ